MRRIPYTAIALALSLALVAVLAWQNRGLRTERDWLIERAAYPYYGMYLPPTEVATLDGATLRIGQPQHEFQILYFFTPQCPHCRDSVPMVRALAGRVRELGGGVRMIGVGNGADADVASYAREHRFDFPVAVVRDRRTLALFRGNTVPLVLLVGADGRVLHSHLGAIDSMDQVGSILAAMRTDSPPAAATSTRSTP